MQAATALPFAAGAILLATVTLNAANPKRNKSPNSSGFASSTGGSRRSIDNNRAMQFSSPEYGGSLSAARRSPIAHSGSFSGGRASRSSSGHSRTQSLNRNVPYTPSATVSMSETLHSRNTSSGSISGGRGRTSTRSSQRVHRRPGHYPTQSLPEFTFPAGNHTSASRRPTYNQPIGFLGSSQVGSENKDQRIPATLF